MYGNSFESSLVAVVVPNKELLTAWAASNGVTGDYDTVSVRRAGQGGRVGCASGVGGGAASATQCEEEWADRRLQHDREGRAGQGARMSCRVCGVGAGRGAQARCRQG